MNLRPLFDKVVLKKAEAVESTKTGILLPGSAQEKPQMSVVVAVGPGGTVDGKDVAMTLKVGDKVTLYADGMQVTATTSNGVITVVDLCGAAATGDEITVRI